MKFTRADTIIVIDFDNTLVDTANVIKKHGYKYSFSQLSYYDRAKIKVRNYLEKGQEIVILSHRQERYRSEMSRMLSNEFNQKLRLVLVRRHFIKWFWVHWWSIRYRHVLVIDDMMRGEETGTPTNLLFPPCLTRRIKVRRGERIIKWRSEI